MSIIKMNLDALKKEWAHIIDRIKSARDIAPIDARIEQEWKAIPGYNGLHIDKEKSLKNLIEAGHWDVSRLIFEEIEPKVSLEDLAPFPIYHGNPQKPMISFMVNVAWGNEYIPKILKILKDYNLRSTFFLNGSWVNKSPEMARKIKDAGHEIGSHAYSHPDMKDLSLNRIQEELDKADEIIQKELGVKPQLFAPPSGSYDTRVIRLATQNRMHTILWTLDTLDWKNPVPEEIIKNIIPKLKNGILILMHPTKSSVKALPAMLEASKRKRYKIGAVSDLVSTKRIYFF